MSPIQPHTKPVVEEQVEVSPAHSSAEAESSSLQWVTVDHPGKLDAKQMSTVRSHVMKRVRQEQSRIHRKMTSFIEEFGLDQTDPGSSNKRDGKTQNESESGQLSEPSGRDKITYYTTHRDEPLQRSAQIARLVELLKSKFEPHPQQLLGAGRIDPFGVYPTNSSTPYLHGVIDHTITYYLPGLLPEGSNVEKDHFREAWFSSALKHPIFFHALVFSGLVHQDYLRNGKIYPNGPMALSHKLAVIKILKEIMHMTNKSALLDEVILSVAILGAHEVMATPSELKWSPFNAPLKALGWLDMYGSISYVFEHWRVAMDLVVRRGGLDRLELYGMAHVLSTGDVTNTTQSRGKPSLPAAEESQVCVDELRVWAKTTHSICSSELAQGFQKYHDQGNMTNAISVFEDMSDLTKATDNYIQGKPLCFTLGGIAIVRTAIQHRLLSLPTGNEAEKGAFDENRNTNSDSSMIPVSLYDACVAAARIYSIAVTFPIPNPRRVLGLLVEDIKEALSEEVIIESEEHAPDLLQWILVLGGMAALDSVERQWFVKALAKFANLWKIDRWESVESVMNTFLWLESACDSGGRLLWDDVIRGRYLI